MFLLCHARRTNHYHDFVTYLEALSNCIAWTLAWVNQKGYVTCSYNVTQDGKIAITILLHIPKHSAAILHGRQPERICNMFLFCHACSFCKISSNARQRQNTTWTFAWPNQRVFILSAHMLIFYACGIDFLSFKKLVYHGLQYRM